MAIDTAAKRRSAAHAGARRWMGVGVTNDATPDGAWRLMAARMYSGIAIGAAAVVAASANLIKFVANVSTGFNR